MILYQKSRILTCIYYYNCDHQVNDSVSKSQCFNCWETGHRKQQCKNERVCGVCRKLGHASRSTECMHYVDPLTTGEVVVFQGMSIPLSNFYPCSINVFGEKHNSAPQNMLIS